MKAVAVFEAKYRFSELIAAVESGEEITITRHGTAVARLVSLGEGSAPASGQSSRVAEAMKVLRQLGQGAALDDTLKQAIEEGRD